VYNALTIRVLDPDNAPHPRKWKRAVMPINITTDQGLQHWCLVLIEKEFNMLTLFEPAGEMRGSRDLLMKQLCSDMEYYIGNH
jgi:hypothetical protein